MKKSFVILLGILLACTNLTSCNTKSAKGLLTKSGKKVAKSESRFLRKKPNEEELEMLRNNGNSAMRSIVRVRLNNSREIDSIYQSKYQPKNNTEKFNFSQALQTHFTKGILDKQPVEIFFENVNIENNALNNISYSVKGKFKTETSDYSINGMLIVIDKITSGSCADSEIEINGIYDLYEKDGHFAGKFTACGNETKLSKANFSGDLTKYSSSKKMPCNFEL